MFQSTYQLNELTKTLRVEFHDKLLASEPVLRCIYKTFDVEVPDIFQTWSTTLSTKSTTVCQQYDSCSKGWQCSRDPVAGMTICCCWVSFVPISYNWEKCKIWAKSWGFSPIKSSARGEKTETFAQPLRVFRL